MATLAGLVVAAGQGHGGLALIEGPAGIGKTRLLHEAARFAREQRLVIAWGVGDELDQLTPWGPLVAALSTTTPPILGSAELVPLGTMLDWRLEALERLRTALERAAANGRAVLVVLDDLQWADPATLAALSVLPRQLFSYPIVWLLARRPLPASAEMGALLARLDGEKALRLRLGPLDPDESVALAVDLLGRLPEGSLNELVRKAGGNPLYLIEALRAQTGADSGAHDPTANQSPTVPGSLRLAVTEHLRTLSAPTSQLIKVASVLGPTFSVTELSLMTGEPAGALVAPIEETLAAQVLVEDNDRLGFRHDLFRQAVYDDLPTSLRWALHRDAAAALLEHGGPVVRAATHLAIGAERADQQTIDVIMKAISELSGTSPPAAADLARRLLDLTSEDDPGRGGLVATVVDLLGWAGRLDEARALGEGYLADHQVPAATEAEILCGIRRAWAMRTTMAYPNAVPRHLLSDPTVPAHVQANLIFHDQVGLMYDHPAQEVDHSLRMASELMVDGDEAEQAALLAVRVALAHEHGCLFEALEMASAAIEAGGELPAFAAAVHYSTLASCLASVGRPREALESLGPALQEASSSGYTFMVSRAQSTRAAVMLELGQVDDARAEAIAAADLAEHLGFEYYFGQAIAALVETSIRQGDRAGAESAADRLTSRHQADRPGDRSWVAALCAEATGRCDVALKHLEPVIEALHRDRFLFAAWYPLRLPHVVAWALQAHDEAVADVVMGASLELARRNPGLVAVQAVAAHARGLRHSDPGSLREAVELFAQGERPLATAQAHEHLGHALQVKDRKDEAVASLEAAYAAYLAVKSDRDLARVRSGLRALGVRKRQPTVARPGRGWDSLTNAELSVVRVVAAGRTNREAATQLFLSPDTINTHLRHAFAKLEIRSRVELARIVLQHEAEPPNAAERGESK